MAGVTGQVRGREQAIARGAVDELRRQGFATYEEVSMGRRAGTGARPDIVGIRGRMTVIVEVKASMSLALLNQLCGWRGRAHWIIGAVEHGRIGAAVERFATLEGFGIWSVSRFDARVCAEIAPRLWRRVDDAAIRRACVPENATGAGFAEAGSAAGGYYTPFRRTARELARLVAAQPGLTVREAMSALDHHYATAKSARASMPECVRRGLVPGVRLEQDGGALRLYPQKETA